MKIIKLSQNCASLNLHNFTLSFKTACAIAHENNSPLLGLEITISHHGHCSTKFVKLFPDLPEVIHLKELATGTFTYTVLIMLCARKL